MNFDTFNKEIISPDFQRKNLFSVRFLSTINMVTKSFDRMNLPQLSTGSGLLNDILNSTQKFVTKKANEKIDSYLNTDDGRAVIALLSSDFAEGVMGRMETGTAGMAFMQDVVQRVVQLSVKAINIPEVSINTTASYSDAVNRTNQVGARADSPVTMTFRCVNGQNFHQAMLDNANYVVNQNNNGRMFKSDLWCDISVIEYDRNQLPVREHLFQKAFVTRVGGMTYDWDDTGIQEFEVEFVYKSRLSSVVGADVRNEYLGELAQAAGKTVGEYLGLGKDNNPSDYVKKPWDMNTLRPNNTGQLGMYKPRLSGNIFGP